MLTRNAVIAVVGAGCIAAAGVGGFLATRLNSAAPAAAGLPTQASVTPSEAQAQASPAARTRSEAPLDAATVPPVALEATTPATTALMPALKPAMPAVAAPRSASSSTRQIPSATTAPAAPPSSSPAQAPDPAQPSTPDLTPDPAPPTPVAAPEPPKAQYEELLLKTDSVIGIRLDTALTSRTARVEDRVSARVMRDVVVDGRTAIPAGARLEGTVTLVEHGDKFRQRARLGVKFSTIVLGDHTRLPIDTDTIFRDGDSPTSEATSKIGASAVIGAVVGAVIGGKKGAAIGGAAGATGGTAAVMAGGVNDATLDAGTPLTVRLTSPVTVVVEKLQDHDGV